MAINSYTTLRDALARWVHRADALPSIPDFIALAEARITADLMTTRAMWQRSRATLAAGASTIALPDDCMSFVGCAVITSGEARELPVVAISSVQWRRSETGTPSMCAVGGETLFLSPAADAATTLELIYHRRIPAIGDSVASNWVLEQAPHLYLYGALIESVGFTAESDKVGQWTAMYEGALDRLRKISWEGPSVLTTDVPSSQLAFDIQTG